MTSATIKITIPDYSPDARIGGNQRGFTGSHPHTERVKSAREIGFAYGLEAKQEVERDTNIALPLTGRLGVEYRVWGSQQDWDNLVKSRKPVLDGLSDAGLIRSDGQIDQWHLYKERGDVRVEIMLFRLDD